MKFLKVSNRNFTVSKFSDKETANKIMGLMKDEIVRWQSCKMSLLEGPRIIEGKILFLLILKGGSLLNGYIFKSDGYHYNGMCSDTNTYFVAESLTSLGHHEDYDEGYHEKLDYLIDRIEQLRLRPFLIFWKW